MDKETLTVKPVPIAIEIDGVKWVYGVRRMHEGVKCDCYFHWEDDHYNTLYIPVV